MTDDPTPTETVYLAARSRYEAARNLGTRRETSRAHLEYLATLRALRAEIEGTLSR